MQAFRVGLCTAAARCSRSLASAASAADSQKFYLLTYDQTQRQWMPGLAPWQAALREALAAASAASAVGGGRAAGKS